MGRSIEPKPDYVDLPDDKTWRDLSPQQRWYYKTSQQPGPRAGTKVIRKEKRGSECVECGEDRAPCLVFHHPDDVEKEFEIGRQGHGGVSIQALKREIEKCELLCANCHAVLHADEA